MIMDLREKLEVIAADYYTKAMAIRTTLQLLDELKSVNKPKKLHWTQTKKGRAKMKKSRLLAWATRRANKNK